QRRERQDCGPPESLFRRIGIQIKRDMAEVKLPFRRTVDLCQRRSVRIGGWISLYGNKIGNKRAQDHCHLSKHTCHERGPPKRLNTQEGERPIPEHLITPRLNAQRLTPNTRIARISYLADAVLYQGSVFCLSVAGGGIFL